LRVLEALPARRPATVDRLMAGAGLDAPSVVRALGALADLGLAQAVGPAWRLRSTRPPTRD
jgi:hypothetical protein